MRMLISLWGLLSIVSMISCQSSEQKTFTLRENGTNASAKGPAFATFSSTPEASEQIRLQLYSDSTFQLEFPSEKRAADRSIQGRLAIVEDHYQLFFPDTVARINQLITPVHPDASVVVYPDGSVALDKALTQFFVKGQLIKIDTSVVRP